jgi:ankyrin repeat protein
MRRLLGIFVAVALSSSAAVPKIEDLDRAIRSNDLAELHQLVQSREAANVCNGLKATPLHYASIYGSVEALQFLLDIGADPNAANQSGATPLILAAWSVERARLLVEHGARVNVATDHGITPLMVAAAEPGNLATVHYLLDKGAELRARDADGEDALIRSARFGDVETLKLLLDRGGDPKHADTSGFTALMGATAFRDSRRIRLLLAAGSDPNALNISEGVVKNGPLALRHLSALMLAAPFSDQETITALLKAGARVDERDIRGMTPLMFSIATDHAQPATVRQMIAAGADIQASDNNGDSVLDWARKFGNPEIVAMLVGAGAKGHEPRPVPVPSAYSAATSSSTNPITNARDSIGRSLALFGKSDFFRAGGGCSGCHHQPAQARAYAAARDANLSPDSGLRKALIDAEIANRPRLASALPYLSTFGGDIDTTNSMMIGNVDLNEPPSEFTDLMVHFLAARQDTSGAWTFLGIARPPIEESNITRTAYAIEILKRYFWPARQAEFDSRIKKAEIWLRQAKPETTYEHADRILGLHAAGLSTSDLQSAADRLLDLQRDGGGWAQSEYLQPDAYATGLVLDALFRTGLLKASEPAYRRGVAFLLRTQFPDGSWFVRSRVPKFQPYFQSGFPFDHDQWISSAGTAWAVMALTHAAQPAAIGMR